jgi:hypothetical protein
MRDLSPLPDSYIEAELQRAHELFAQTRHEARQNRAVALAEGPLALQSASITWECTAYPRRPAFSSQMIATTDNPETASRNGRQRRSSIRFGVPVRFRARLPVVMGAR